MSDMIDRQATIAEIMEDIKDRSLHDDPATPEDFAEGYDEGIRNAAAIVLQMPSAKPGWIPVTERLPKPNEEDGNGFYKAYLVQDGRWMDVARWDGKYWIAWGYSTVLLNVVAWMPLPAPYIPEGDDKHEG